MLYLFYACSGEEELKNESVVQKSTNLTKRNGSDLTEVSAIAFSEAILTNYDDLNFALHQNLYVGFNDQTLQMLNSAQTENDVKIVFEQAGIANSQEVIDALNAIVQAQQNFLDQNPNFHNLTQEQQIQYLNTGIEVAKSTFVSSQPVTPNSAYFTTPCARNFNQSIDRCTQDFAICGVFAVVSAGGGLVPGLVAAAYCMTTKVVCDKRAKYDYADCIESTEGGLGTNYELTLHCDQDSCWATYANGQYVRRVE